MPDTNRLSELLGALSLATDLSAGQPPGAALCATVLSTRLGAAMGLPEPDLAGIYYACITRFIGCTSTAGDVAAFALGDELSANYAFTLADPVDPESARHFMETCFALDQQQEAREQVIEATLGMLDQIPAMGTPHCEQAVALTRRLPVPEAVPLYLAQLESRWDGRNPVRKGGEDVPLGARIIEYAVVAELHRRAGGLRSMAEVTAHRSGGQFDPAICALFLGDPAKFTAGLGASADWELYLDTEPGAPILVGPARMRAVAEAFADFADNKSRWFVGHSRQVAGLAYRAALARGLHEPACQALFDAALLHDIGRAAIPNGIWDKPGPLTRFEAQQAETHSFHTEKILSMTAAFEPVCDTACSAHERADGSGYHRRIRLADGPAALLATANLYDELTHDRPDRAALDATRAADRLLDEAAQGRLPRDEVRAVLDSAGHARALSDKVYPDELTPREAEVLMHLARGLTGKEIARKLSVAPKTVDNHTQNLYKKIGAQSRTAAAMYAFEQGIFTP